MHSGIRFISSILILTVASYFYFFRAGPFLLLDVPDWQKVLVFAVSIAFFIGILWILTFMHRRDRDDNTADGTELRK